MANMPSNQKAGFEICIDFFEEQSKAVGTANLLFLTAVYQRSQKTSSLVSNYIY